MAMDKKRFYNMIHDAGMAGCIPMVIGEGLRESQAYSKGDGHIGYWVTQNINQHC